MRKLNIAAAVLAAAMLAAALPQAASAATQINAGVQLAVPSVSGAPAPAVDDFVRPEPPAGRAKAEYTYVSAPLAGTMKTTLLTVQLADKSAAETDAAVPMAAAVASVNAAKNYWRSATAGRVDITLVETRTLHKSAARSTQSPGDIADIVTAELGWRQDPYTALVMFIPGGTLNNGAAGMTYSNGNIGGRIVMPQNSRLSTPVMAHEFGHTLGMDHANSLQCGSGVSDVGAGPFAGFADSTCTIRPYGDNVDLMGISHFDLMPVISASFWEMGRFGNGDEIADLGTIASTRSVTLRPWAGSGANRAAKFTDPKSGEVYYLELRAPVGYDTGIAQSGNFGVKITQQGGGNSSILLPPDTRPFSGYYSNSQSWQAGQTFTTHAGTKVSIDSVSTSAAAVTIRPPGGPAMGYAEKAAITRSGDSATLQVSGWALDSAKSSESSAVHIYVTTPAGVQTGYALTADQPRADVNTVMGVAGNHGFSRSFDLTAAGVYRVCVYALGSVQTAELGCRSLALDGSAPPAGYLESLSLVKANGVTVLRALGWSYDPGTPAASIPVHIYVTDPAGRTTSRAITADLSRPDVNQVMGVPGAHGYSTDVPVAAGGQYTVCTYGLAVSRLTAGNSLLGCKTVTPQTTPAPIGYLDSTVPKTDARAASITVNGWTLDPGTPASSIPVHLYVTAPDGTTTATPYTADQVRNDVNQVMGSTGNHGYRVSVPARTPGTYRICAYGLAVSPFPLGNSLLGCQSVAVAATPAPIGYLESAKVQLGGATSAIIARGWGLDPGMAGTSIPVHLYVTYPDGTTGAAPYVADRPRADVNSIIQVPGDHGYEVSVPVLQRGTYKICAWGLGVAGLSAGNTLLGCLSTTY